MSIREDSDAVITTNYVRDTMITEEEVLEVIQNYSEYVTRKIDDAETSGVSVVYFYRNSEIDEGLFCTAHNEIACRKNEYVSMPVTTVKTLLLLIN